MVFDTDWTRHDLPANGSDERLELDNLFSILEIRGDSQFDLFLPQKTGIPKYFKPSGMMGMSSKDQMSKTRCPPCNLNTMDVPQDLSLFN